MNENKVKLCNIIDCLIDDIWINCFILLNVKDFLSVCKTCKHFYKLANDKNCVRIDKYWEYQCQELCADVKDHDFITKDIDWRQLYQILINCFTRDSLRPINKSSYINKDKYSSCLPVTISKENGLLNAAAIKRAMDQDNLLVFRILTYNLSDMNTKLVNTYIYQYYGQVNCLWYCARQNSIKITKYLLSQPGIDLNLAPSKVSDTPLMIASLRRNDKICELLLNDPRMTKQGINMCDNLHRTALSYACFQAPGCKQIIKLLLNDERVDVNIPDKHGVTPLIKAVSVFMGVDIIDLFVNNERVDVKHKDNCGRTALNCAKSLLSVFSKSVYTNIREYADLVDSLEKRVESQSS